jgi:hypothetical protein
MDSTPEQFSKTMYAADIVPLWKLIKNVRQINISSLVICLIAKPD